jgi:undecaprenyl-diphosphatase
VKFFFEGNALARKEILMLATGMICSFLTSLIVIRFLLNFVKRHSFFGFGIYRILLASLVLLTLFL